MTATPENTGLNYPNDALFQQKLYVGTDEEQFEVRERFEKNEQDIKTVAQQQSAAGGATSALNHRVETLENEHQTLKNNQTGLAESVTEIDTALETHVDNADLHVNNLIRNHPNNATVHVSDFLRNHPGNAEVHVPPLGSNGQFLGVENGLLKFIDLVINESGNAGIVGVTPDAVIAALGEYTASRWTLVGKPLGNTSTKIRSAHFASNRFLIGGDDGNASASWDATRWASPLQLFDDPIEDFATGRLPDGTDVHIAMNAYSDFKISLDGKNWSPRLSIMFSYDENMNPHDKYATPDFTGLATGHGHFVMFTASGRVLRATFEQILHEYQRIVGNPSARASTVWQQQTSNSTVTRNMLRGTFGRERFVAVGRAGVMTVSTEGAFWETINARPFGGATVNDIDFGDGKFLIVGNGNRIAFSDDILNWTFVDGPFDADDDIFRCKYGGVWVVVSSRGRIATSTDGRHWTLRESPFVVAGRAIAFGNTTFIIGDDVGNVAQSISLADLFSSVTYSEFAQLVDRCDDWMNAKTSELNVLKQYVLDELAKQLKIGELPGQPSIRYGKVGETGNAADQGHRHDNSNEVLQSQLDRATLPPSFVGDNVHLRGVPILDDHGKLYAKNQTWPRAEATGDQLAPVDADGLIPAQYIDRAIPRNVIFKALIAWSLDLWTLRSAELFEAIGEWSTITGAASSTMTVVLVGEQGRIAFGPHVRQLRRAVSPFGAERIVGIAFGINPQGEEIFITATKTHWATSVNGEHWTEAVLFEGGEIESMMFGGGKFLMPTSEGDIFRTEWTPDGFEWAKQTSSKTVTKGVRKIAYLENRYCGVGANNLIVGSDNAEHWHTEQSPCPADTAWNDVFPGDGVFVTIGDKGRAASAEPGKTWTELSLPTTGDLLCGVFEKEHYVVAGKNGLCVTATRLNDWVMRTLPTNATVRVAFWNKHACVLATDAGQLVISATAAEALGLYDEDTGLGPSNDDPRSLALLACAGLLNTYSRADHVHPWTEEVLKKMIGEPNGVCPLDLAALIPTQYMPWQRGEPNGVASLDEDGVVPDEQLRRGEPDGVASLDENGVIPDAEIRRGLPNGVAATDENNILAREHWPEYDDIIKEVVVIMQTGREFKQVFSPFHRGPLVSSILHDADCYNGNYVMVGEAGIGYTNDPLVWQLSDNQPFGNVPVIGCRFGEDDRNEIVCVAVDTQHRIAVSRDFGRTWSEPFDAGPQYDFSCLDYYNRTFTILCHGGQVLRLVWVDGEFFVEEQADSPTITEHLTTIRGGNGLWLAVGNNGRVRTSVNASHFVPKTSGTNLDLFSMTHGNGEFLIGAAGGNVFRTVDGETLTLCPKPFESNADIIATRFIGTLFFVTNRNGELAVGDGDQWNVQDCPLKGHPMRAISGDGNSFTVGDDLGNIAVSTSVKLNIGGDCRCKTTLVGLGVKISGSADGNANVKLLKLENGIPQPTGGTVQNVVMVRAADKNAVDLAELVGKARIDNPMNEVIIV